MTDFVTSWRDRFEVIGPAARTRPSDVLITETPASREVVAEKKLRYTVLQDQLLVDLEKSRSDFRTIRSLASSVGASEAEVRDALSDMSSVRRPYGGYQRERDLYRLESRGLTSKERIRYWGRLLSRRTR